MEDNNQTNSKSTTSSNSRTAQFTMVTFATTNVKEKANNYGPTDQNTKVNGGTTKPAVTVNLPTNTEAVTKVNGGTTVLTDTEFLSIAKVKNIKVTGKRISLMEKVNKIGKMEVITMDSTAEE